MGRRPGGASLCEWLLRVKKKQGNWTHGVEDILLGFGFPLEEETQGRGFDSRWVFKTEPFGVIRQPARWKKRPKDAGSIPAGSVKTSPSACIS